MNRDQIKPSHRPQMRGQKMSWNSAHGTMSKAPPNTDWPLHPCLACCGRPGAICCAARPSL
eukprot:7538446-Pyramimonas_sp.AAC.1